MTQLIDVARVRADTPSCEQILHFNNAGAALMTRAVNERQIEHLRLEERIGGYEAAVRAHDELEGFYSAAALLLGCREEEVAFMENATRAWDMAFYGIRFRPGDRILTASAEYASNYIAYLQVAERTGVSVEVVPDDEDGQLSVEALREMLDERVRLVAVTHIPTNGGLVNPAVEIGRVAKEAGALYLLDACQSVGQMPIDVEEIGCDFLSATGRKYLRGPRATGLLFVAAAAMERVEPAFLDLHAAEWTAPDRYRLRGDARRFETWEQNLAGKLGLSHAISYALDLGLEAIRERVVSLAATLRTALAAVPGATLHDRGRTRSGIVTFSLDGHPAENVVLALRTNGINTSLSPPSSTLIDATRRDLPEMIRASVHYYNTEREIERFRSAVLDVIGGSEH